jgi:hypothetical protein
MNGMDIIQLSYCQGMFEVPQDIFNVFNAYAQADEIRSDSGMELFFFI